MHIKEVFERGDSEDRNLESVGKEKAAECEITVVIVSNTEPVGLQWSSEFEASKLQLLTGCTCSSLFGILASLSL